MNESRVGVCVYICVHTHQLLIIILIVRNGENSIGRMIIYIYIYSVYIWLEYTLCFYLGSNWDCVWESQKGGGNDNEYMWGDSGYGT